MTRLKSPGQALVTRVLFVGKVIGPQAIGPGAAVGGLVAVAFAKLRIASNMPQDTDRRI